ncbi:MAG: DUF6517 family protein, partial [Haloarculaceae archaeon]
LANVAVVALLLTAGCIGFLTGEEALAFDADPVRVADDARAEAGYEEVRVESMAVNRSFTVAGETRNVSVTNHVAAYQRAVDLGPLGSEPFARFTVLSTPEVEIAGRTLNPVGGLSDRELATRLQSQYDSIENVRFAGNRTVEVLGEGRTVSRFDATTTVAGTEVDLALHVAKFRHGEDFVVAIGVYPARLDGERARVETMLRGIEHETAG